MVENRGHLLPVYMVADQSGSMAGVIAELNAGLTSLHRALLGEPMASAKIRLSLLGFSNSVHVRLALADIREESELPALSAGGGTNYDAVFECLRTRIPQDIGTLKSEGYRVYRPTVFFLSDGQPFDDGWRTSLKQLTDRSVMPGAPNIIAFGIGDAEAETIGEVATDRQHAYVSLPGAQLGDSVADFCATLTKSVVESGRALASGSTDLPFPQPEGFIRVDEV